MFPNPITPTVHIPHSDTLLRRLLGGMSFFTMLMTIPQVLTIWSVIRPPGFPLLSWIATLSLPFYGFGSGYRNMTRTSIAMRGLDGAR